LSATCEHLNSITEQEPNTFDGCEDCLAIGGRWVHLRLCMQCGHVGCCDSSPHRHATAHTHATAHPVVQSFEPGERWAFCYADQTVIEDVGPDLYRSYTGS
jgi:uncharacterized UBP type Zn finger protein